jgi:predicted transcriptional regulator
MKKRNEYEVQEAILYAIQNKSGIIRTRLLYKANLSHEMMIRYIKILTKKGLIT